MGNDLVDFMLKILASEVDAVRKYTMYHCVLADQGYIKTAEVFLKEAQEERGHMQKLQERLLFMDAIPGYEELPAITARKDVSDIVSEMIAAEEEAIDMYYEAIKKSIDMGDHGNVIFFQKILTDEEEHYQWLKTQQQMINLLGSEGYLQVVGKE